MSTTEHIPASDARASLLLTCGNARYPPLMGGDPQEFVPSERIALETSLPCATSVPLPGGLQHGKRDRRIRCAPTVYGPQRRVIGCHCMLS
jgi:hypothetical protein